MGVQLTPIVHSYKHPWCENPTNDKITFRTFMNANLHNIRVPKHTIRSMLLKQVKSTYIM